MNPPLLRSASRILVALLVLVAMGPAVAAEGARSLPVTAPGAAPAAAHRQVAPRPTACAHRDDFVWSHLAACGWPGPHNTGAAAGACPGGRLTDRSGSPTRVIAVTKPGSVISCERIVGCLDVRASGVVIEHVRIECTSGRTGTAANGTAVIKIEDGASATIRHVGINGLRGVHACIWHQGTSMVATHVNCGGVDDGIFSWADTGYSPTTGDHFVIRDSYFHDFTTHTANGHIDGYQTEGASYGVIDHNTFLMTSDANNESDSAIAIWNSLKGSRHITVRDNLITGGGFSIYAEDYSPSESAPAGGYTVTDIRFVDNVFSRHLFGCVGYFGVWFPRGNPTDGWRRTGNHLLGSSGSLDHGNPSFHGRPCT